MTDLNSPDRGAVLIVDDDDDQRFAVAALFRQAGYHNIIEVGDGDSALAVAEDQQPALIVLDLVMPGTSGLDVLPRLRSSAPAATTVVLSNLPRHLLLDAVRRAGAVGYVEKCTPPQRLVRDILLAWSLIDAVQSSQRFDPQPSAPREARGFVRDVLDGAGTELSATAELLVSELVANALEHASGGPDVSVVLLDHSIRVEVFDDDGTAPTMQAPESTNLTGRGLTIVNRLATRWSVEHVGTAKIVWFELDRHDSTTSSLG